MFTCNLRNGGWWESQIADTSLVVTDAIAYRLNPWQTQNIVGTADGRVLQFILGYQQDDATSFPCSWQSAIFSAKSFFGMDHEVASLQTLRVITGPPFNSGSKVNFTLNHGDNLDRMVTTAFANPQILDGMSELFAIERPASNSLFQVVASSATAAQFPPIAQLELGAIAQGALR
jgi:hypothetical protein